MPKSVTPNASSLSEFFLLYPDATGSDLEAVDDYDLGELDVTLFWDGQQVDESVISQMTTTLTSGERTDCLGNPMSWQIVSMKCANQLRRICGDSVQFIPLPTTDPSGVKSANRYCVVNPLVVVDAIVSTKKNKRKIPLVELVLQESSIPDGLNLFRLAQQENTIVANSSIIKMIQDRRYVGFAASPLDLR